VVCWTKSRVDDAEAAALGAVPLPLDDLLRSSDIVTLHAPDLPATHHMPDRGRLALTPDGGVLINTSRGALVDHEALTEELVSGRISAVLDVTDPEPLPVTSPLHALPNVLLTPHTAASVGNELAPARLDRRRRAGTAGRGPSAGPPGPRGEAVHQRVTAWWGGSSTPYAPSRTAPSVADGRVGADAPSAGRRLLRQRLGFCGGGVRVSAFVSP
jgi:hypothetical protein